MAEDRPDRLRLVRTPEGGWRSWDALHDDCMDRVETMDVVPVEDEQQSESNQSASPDIEKRVAISLAVGRYLRTADRFSEASKDYTAACKTLRQKLGASERFVVQVNYQHYLVSSDADGNFDVEFVSSL